MNKRTILLAVVGLVAIGAAAWVFYLQDMLMPEPPPQVAMPAKPAPKPEAPKPAATPVPRDLASMDAAVKASQVRVAELEKEIVDLRQQVAAKDREIAEMEKKVGAKK